MKVVQKLNKVNDVMIAKEFKIPKGERYTDKISYKKATFNYPDKKKKINLRKIPHRSSTP